MVRETTLSHYLYPSGNNKNVCIFCLIFTLISSAAEIITCAKGRICHRW